MKLRGKRFAESQRQADFLVAELEKGTENEVKTLLRYIAKKLWTITFARDNLLSTSSTQQYVAQLGRVICQSRRVCVSSVLGYGIWPKISNEKRGKVLQRHLQKKASHRTIKR